MFPTGTESVIHCKFHFISCGHNTTIIHKAIAIVINFITFSITFSTNIVCFFITLEEEFCDTCFPWYTQSNLNKKKTKKAMPLCKEQPKDFHIFLLKKWQKQHVRQ
jgi:membrane glycosyltransferase